MSRAPWARIVRDAILVIGLVALVSFWVMLALSDTAISPVAFVDVSDGLLVGLTAVHVVSALLAWGVATVSAITAGRGLQLAFAIVVVPAAAVVTLLVMMTDALVWRGDAWSWAGPALMASVGPVTLAGLLVWSLASARPAVPAPRTGGRPRGIAPAIAIIAVIAVVAVAATMLRGATTPTGGWEWSGDTDGAMTVAGDALGEAVTSGGPGFVAVGEVQDATSTGIVWTSTDGRAWTRVPDRDGVFAEPGGAAGMVDVVATPEVIVAVGYVYRLAAGADEDTGAELAMLPAVWTSADAVSWTRSWVGSEEARIRAVAAAGPGFVAVGDDGAGGAVWTSHDGATWTRVADPVFAPDLPQAAEGPPPTMQLHAVAAGGPGVVAVGQTARYEHPDGSLSDAQIRAVVLTSADGQSWTRVAHDEEVFGGLEPHTMSAVTPTDAGLVAVGTRLPRGPAAWTSADGVDWQRHLPADRDLDDVRLHDVTATVPAFGAASTLVAVGQDWGPLTGSRRDVVAVLTSDDGVTWTRDADRALTLGRDHQVSLSGVAASPHGVVAVGSIIGPSGMDATSWFAPGAAFDR